MAANKRVIDWKGKTVWIVGASSGIGYALAESLMLRGARVALSARRADRLYALSEKTGIETLVLPMSVTEENSWKDSYSKLIATWGTLDEFIYCAADYEPMNAWSLDIGKVRHLLDVNVMGFYLGLSCIVPDFMKRRSGGMAAIASVAGYHGLPKALAYGPTKAALINLMESLYIDLHEMDIAVRLINPGFVKTDLTSKNDFDMPDLITPDQASAEILEGYASGDFEIHFPKGFTRKMKLLGILPYRASLGLVRNSTKGNGHEN